MSYNIPHPFTWDESFRTFYDQIDNEHKRLFLSIFNIVRVANNAERLDQMRNVMSYHFINEQAIMESAGYPALDKHIALHDAFLAKLDGFKAPVSIADIQYAKDWLVNHIKVEDFKYKGKLV